MQLKRIHVYLVIREYTRPTVVLRKQVLKMVLNFLKRCSFQKCNNVCKNKYEKIKTGIWSYLYQFKLRTQNTGIKDCQRDFLTTVLLERLRPLLCLKWTRKENTEGVGDSKHCV